MPERTCRICRTKRPQAELVRWSWQEDALVKSAHGGRGLYSCLGECSDKLEMHKTRFKH